MERSKVTAEERFWQLVDKTESCWIWKGTTNLDHYGRFNEYYANGKSHLTAAHRFSYKLKNGEIPEGICVLHTCDNPRCVNPDHLFLGTHSDNMQDMYKKKRHGNGKPCVCHPDRPYHCKGLCRQCYLKAWHKAHPEKMTEYARQSYRRRKNDNTRSR